MGLETKARTEPRIPSLTCGQDLPELRHTAWAGSQAGRLGSLQSPHLPWPALAGLGPSPWPQDREGVHAPPQDTESRWAKCHRLWATPAGPGGEPGATQRAIKGTLTPRMKGAGQSGQSDGPNCFWRVVPSPLSGPPCAPQRGTGTPPRFRRGHKLPGPCRGQAPHPSQGSSGCALRTERGSAGRYLAASG